MHAAWVADQLRSSGLSELALAEGWTDAAALDAMAQEVLAWGERPDAFFALVGVAAVGWVDH